MRTRLGFSSPTLQVLKPGRIGIAMGTLLRRTYSNGSGTAHRHSERSELSEEKTKRENLAEVNQDLRSEATQRTTGEKVKSYKKSIKLIGNRATRTQAKTYAGEGDIKAAQS